ncbi:ADP-ribosylglycohydrolase family protein, partial [Streptomyces sp. NPDC058479]|uniref:ADP-ribosylglycohydrolase family protein n=1 Tax=Streptomyces sp. NPDC058479 TaxID=3346521 RepID=UPI00365161A7
MDDRDRAVGAVVGSAVGDALGAPFEFGPEGAFSARFPRPGGGGEMCGGGGWDPGEATDDTQMAVLVAESRGGRGARPPPRTRPPPARGAPRHEPTTP